MLGFMMTKNYFQLIHYGKLILTKNKLNIKLFIFKYIHIKIY
jgi:hypothetical protein